MRLLRCCLVLATATAAALGAVVLLLPSASAPGPATFAGLLTRWGASPGAGSPPR